MATTRSSWGDCSGPNSPHAASPIPGEQEAAKAAVVDEAALLAEDLCAASPQHGADRFSADQFVPRWICVRSQSHQGRWRVIKIDAGWQRH